jgi:hypothetical protein
VTTTDETLRESVPPVATPQPPEDVRPAGLRVTTAERNFLPLLHTFLPTPRAGKKFVNLYRLTRISVQPDELPSFLGEPEKGGPYQAVMILLAVLVGRADQAHALFRAIQEGDPEDSLGVFLRSDGPTMVGGRTPISSDSWADLENLRTELASAADGLSDITPVVTTLGEYQRWSTRIARFSFSGGGY